MSSRCGAKDRIYRNTLLFLAATNRGVGKLRQAYRERTALQGVRRDYGDQLEPEPLQDLNKRLEAAERGVNEAFGPAYTVLMRLHGAGIEVAQLSDARPSFQEHLGYAWTTLVEDEEWILRRVGSVTLQKTGLVLTEGGIRVKEAVDTFLRFTDKPMIASKESVSTSLAQACKDGVIGIGRGATITNLQSRYCKDDVDVDASEDGLWIIPPFEKVTAPTGDVTYQIPSTTGAPSHVRERSDLTPSRSGKPARRIRRLHIKGSVPVENWGELFRSFIAPGTRLSLQRQALGVEFDFQFPDASPLTTEDGTIKAMREAARQLGLAFEIQEEDDAGT